MVTLSVRVTIRIFSTGLCSNVNPQRSEGRGFGLRGCARARVMDDRPCGPLEGAKHTIVSLGPRVWGVWPAPWNTAYDAQLVRRCASRPPAVASVVKRHARNSARNAARRNALVARLAPGSRRRDCAIPCGSALLDSFSRVGFRDRRSEMRIGTKGRPVEHAPRQPRPAEARRARLGAGAAPWRASG